MRSLKVASALAMLTAGCTGKPAGMSDQDRSQAIDRLAGSVAKQRALPGMAIAVLRGGKPFHIVTLGYSDLGTRSRVSPTTPFQLASTTKIFSSAGVLRLVADGKVGLDNPIGDYLKDIPHAWRAITIRQLLSYTSGLPDVTRATGDVELVAQDWDRALPIVRDQPFQFRPGTGWAYTQTNYALLLRLIERISGRSFEAFLHERLFEPLGMNHTFFPDAQHHCATNYKRDRNGRIVGRPELQFPHYVHAAGGLCSSVNDLISWSDAFDSGKVIPADLVRQAQTPTKLTDGSNAVVGPQASYGLGWAIGIRPEHPWAGHSGGNSSAFRRYLKDNVIVIVVHNGDSDPDAIAASVADAMFATSGAQDAQAELWDAAANGDQPEILAALQHGADPNKLDTRSSRNGRYALNWAAFNDHPKLIPVLLSHGARIDAQNLTGFTALHHAAESGSVESARALLAAGADTSLRTQAGETAADVARRKGHAAIVQLIETQQPKRH
jgi:CubicO group peptidase (beta-lactamase class C family)